MKKPASVRAYEIQSRTRETLAYESAQFRQLFALVYGGDIADAQATMDAIPANGPTDQPPSSAAQVFAVSGIQAVTHNVSLGLLSDPALLTNPNVQALIAAVQACRADEAIPKEIDDTLPFAATVNPDGTVTYSELPDEEGGD